MKRAGVVLLALTMFVALSAFAARSSTYMAIDRCLDAGNAWDYRTSSCGALPSGPVDRIFVDKSEHLMATYRNGRIVREFRVALGWGGLRPKQRQGDGRVPEGTYLISAHNPHSAYYLSLRIGYPTLEQAAEAANRGVDAGGDIMIHGLPNGRNWIGSRHRKIDWTDGCIAVTDPEMRLLYDAVPDGTPVEIRA